MIVAGFEFPDDLYVLAEHQVWARVGQGTEVTVGISALGIAMAGGEVYMCRPKPVGSRVAQGQGVAVVEVAKAVVSVKSPVSGQVLAVNPALAGEPEWVHRDPFGHGWLVRIDASDLPAELERLVRGEPGRAAHERLAWLYGHDA